MLNFSAAQYTVAENAGNATITVIRSGVVSVPVTVNFATANGTATAGSDYTAASGTLSFAANELQKTFNVPITDDSAVESKRNGFAHPVEPNRHCRSRFAQLGDSDDSGQRWDHSAAQFKLKPAHQPDLHAWRRGRRDLPERFRRSLQCW